jgi:hypothetical protein
MLLPCSIQGLKFLIKWEKEEHISFFAGMLLACSIQGLKFLMNWEKEEWLERIFHFLFCAF